MKIDRLIGIITILLQKEKTTIAQLAERFEVSGRTIQRDIDHICKAGIPIVSMQGYGGGLSIAEGYKINQTILTQEELSVIFMGLKSVDSVSKYTYTQSLMEKFAYKKRAVLSCHNRIIIDLATFYQVSLIEKIELIKQAINNREPECITFDNQSGKLIFENNFTNRNYLLQWILSYGDAVKVIEPLDLMDEICLNAKKNIKSI
ncbi:HTH domain-containing protein [Lacrimispora sp. AGF001]|uniref:HTH domain-containing protein n=1 Tax=Lacrimispora sp. AGF001 TaxID=3401631 RepID=UPI003B430F09